MSKGCEVRWRVVEKGASEKPANEKVTDINNLSADAVGLSARLSSSLVRF